MIVIPMAGLSSRFFREGYRLPKYMLEAHGKSVFEHSLESFADRFQNEFFLFIAKREYDAEKFIWAKARSLGIKKFEVILLDRDTRGQAESVYEGLCQCKEENQPLIIFNIDTFRLRPFVQEVATDICGCLEVFFGEGENWSFVKPAHEAPYLVSETAEKRAISNLCCTGLYYFKSTDEYKRVFVKYASKPESEWDGGELYVAPLYNVLIESGKKVSYTVIDRKDVVFSGVPSEFETFKSSSFRK